MKLKSIKCYAEAFKDYFKHGVFVPHVYKDISAEKAIIIATDKSFRVSENWAHNFNERVYPHALLITSECECCGKKSYSWYRNAHDYGKDGWCLNGL